jgi:hypothetical protein
VPRSHSDENLADGATTAFGSSRGPASRTYRAVVPVDGRLSLI